MLIRRPATLFASPASADTVAVCGVTLLSEDIWARTEGDAVGLDGAAGGWSTPVTKVLYRFG